MTITFKVPAETGAKIRDLASRRRVTRSQFLRDLVDAEVKRKKPRGSLYDAMKDAIGCVDSGVTDRATNPKYMKGFGQWRR
jgi:hypothetical protein